MVNATGLKYSDIITDMNEAILQSRIAGPNSVYIDLPILIDVFIGAILSIGLSKEQYELFIDNMDKINTRIIDDIEYLLPELNITNKQVQDMYINHSNKVFKMSPTFKFQSCMASISKAVELLAIRNNKKKYKVILNTYPLTLSKDIKSKIRALFTNILNINIALVKYDIGTITDIRQLLSVDELWIYDINRFVDNSIIKKAFEEEKWLDKSIVSLIKAKSVEILKDKSEERIREEKDIIDTCMKLNTLEFTDLSNKR